MRVVLFAHVPPPHHGQSVMVQTLLEGLGGDRRRPIAPVSQAAAAAGPGPGGAAIECYHVDARLSTGLEDVGRMRWAKLFRLFGYCGQAWWARIRYGADTLYYVPSPPKRSALYRDWVVMLLCRPWFRRVVFHWHAVGLGEWLEGEASSRERGLSHRLLDGADMAIVLSALSRGDAERFRPRRVAVVANGMADPCPDYRESLGPLRAARARERAALLAGRGGQAGQVASMVEEAVRVRVLYLAHCTREKGLFDTIEGVRMANQQLAAQGVRLRLSLRVAGEFPDSAEKTEFDRLAAGSGGEPWVEWLGFVAGAKKEARLREADVFCFPTYFANEGQPMNLIEAMAFGLPLVTTRWRAIPEFIPEGYPGLIEPRQPAQVAAGLLAVLTQNGDVFREIFLRRFTRERHLEAMVQALGSVAADA